MKRRQERRGTAAQWTSANPILAAGEWGIELDTNRQKVGNGSSAWNLLAYSDAPARTYADGLITTEVTARNTAISEATLGLWDDRGNFDASVNTYPTTGGSGTAGAIKKGDVWLISVAATSGALNSVPVGAAVRALTDTPGQTGGNWSVGGSAVDQTARNMATAAATSLQGTSATSLAIGSGTKTFTTQSGKAWTVGQFVLASYDITRYMIGQVVSYSGSTLVLSVPSDGYNSGGTFASWTLNLTGKRGGQGSTGNTGVGGAGYDGASATELTIGTGSKTLTLDGAYQFYAFASGQRLRFISTASPSNWMEGAAVRSGLDLTITVATGGTNGSGTFSAWTVAVAGEKGATGATGAEYSPANAATLALLSGTSSLLFNGVAVGGSLNSFTRPSANSRKAITIGNGVVLGSFVFQQDISHVFQAVNLSWLPTDRGWIDLGEYQSPPSFGATPEITGAPETGMECSTPVAWGLPAPDIAYQWQKNVAGDEVVWVDCTGTGNATNAYTPPSSEVQIFRCQVTMTNVYGYVVTYSNTIAVSPRAPVLNSVALTGIYGVGNAAIGSVIGANPAYEVTGVPIPTLSYEWYLSVDPGPIDEELSVLAGTGATYIPIGGDQGKNLVCRITNANSEGSSTVDSESAEIGYKPTLSSVAMTDGFDSAPVYSVGELVRGHYAGNAYGGDIFLTFYGGTGGVTQVQTDDPDYVIQDLDSTINFQVSMQNAYGEASLTTGAQAVESPPFFRLDPPDPVLIYLTAGDTALEVTSLGTWARAGSFSYQWFCEGVAITGETDDTFNFADGPAQEAGFEYFCRVGCTNEFGGPITTDSDIYTV